AYVDDLIDWAVGTSAGLTQTSEKVAGTNLYHSIGLPGALKARRVGTIYGVILHVTVVLLLLASIVLALGALGRKIAADARWRREKREAKRAGMLIPERPVV
ncbi:alpha/beta hydrolase, partial [Bifidobacterium longum]|nr:alpha/beta hydrolase [Bifidobacterium longum]